MAEEREWNLTSGDTIRRVDLHDRYGGNRQGGISPSAMTPHVMIFSEAASGQRHGYFDRWDEDGVFHYTGEGQGGDQRMQRGNAAILNHRQNGKALRVFQGVGGVVRYLGEFELLDPAWYTARAPETGNGPMRDVFIFRLRPIDAEPPGPPPAGGPDRPIGAGYRPADETGQIAAPEPFAVDPNVVDRGRRGHAITQNALASFVEGLGYQPLSPVGEIDYDLAWQADDVLYVAEVKSLTDANESKQLRLGLGQVLDYQDGLSAGNRRVRGVLAVERKPTDDRWVQLCARLGVVLVWPNAFEALRPGVA